ncbi:restriction endonuclease subunit S [uncultured Clostridium sp.]|uniref:restriction endonuclease subunit S n=1 Tax=uncultured Clostridium sp. TaxID=59620 RepID=UPI0025E5D2BA|nr:restriction endonuclease subunit S [uncultured Clostridium sp.]
MSIKISDICDINSSNISSKDNYEFINYLDTSNLTEGVIDTLQKLVVGEDKIPSRAKRKVKKNDVLISTVRPNQKHYGILRKLKENLIVSTGFVVLSAKEDIVDAEYLYRYLTQDSITNYLQAIGETSTSAYPSIKPSDIGSLEIELPQLEEQKAIAKVLLDLDKKIEINNKINKKLEEMAQAIFKQWFVDFEFPNEDGKPYKSSGGEMVESELGIIPEGWKIKELKEVIKFNKGKKPKIITDKEFDNSKLYLTIDVLNRNSIQYAINDKVVLANKKDILMVMDGASSGSLYYGLDGIVGSTLSKLVINDEYINDDILYYFLKLNEFNIKGHLTGSAIPHTDKEYVNRLIMCIPNDKELLVRVTKILSDIREKVIINNEENSRLIKLRDILLLKLMSGEIRVPLGHE